MGEKKEKEEDEGCNGEVNQCPCHDSVVARTEAKELKEAREKRKSHELCFAPN